MEPQGRDCLPDAPRRRLGREVRRPHSIRDGDRPIGAAQMKVVLFCGGRGTRIRDYSETIPKPMIPLGHQPILRHVMQWYSDYGHDEFVLCMGYKANVIKDFFLNMRPQTFSDCVVSRGGQDVRLLGEAVRDWQVTLLDTGIWRNIGERLWAAREHVRGEKMFLAN